MPRVALVACLIFGLVFVITLVDIFQKRAVSKARAQRFEEIRRIRLANRERRRQAQIPGNSVGSSRPEDLPPGIMISRGRERRVFLRSSSGAWVGDGTEGRELTDDEVRELITSRNALGITQEAIAEAERPEEPLPPGLIVGRHVFLRQGDGYEGSGHNILSDEQARRALANGQARRVTRDNFQEIERSLQRAMAQTSRSLSQVSESLGRDFQLMMQDFNASVQDFARTFDDPAFSVTVTRTERVQQAAPVAAPAAAVKPQEPAPAAPKAVIDRLLDDPIIPDD